MTAARRFIALACLLALPALARAQWLMPPWASRPIYPAAYQPYHPGNAFNPYNPYNPYQPPHPPEPVARPLSRAECINFDFAVTSPSAFLKLRIERTTPENRKVLQQRALFILKFDTHPLALGTARWVAEQVARLPIAPHAP